MTSSPPPLPPLPADAKLVQQGAEARVFACTFVSRPCIAKERFRKSYRHPELDERLTQRRLLQEARSIARARRCGVAAPAVYLIDRPSATIFMERIDGLPVRQCIDENRIADPNALAISIGSAIAQLHDSGLIHGDLTTSNMLVHNTTGELVMIDFGLSSSSVLPEDKAVDLYVLERAFLSSHPNTEHIFAEILRGYQKKSKNGKVVLAKLEQVRMRGRKKSMIG